MKNTLLFLFALLFQNGLFAQTEINEASTSIPTQEYMDLFISKIEIPEKIHAKANNQNILATIILLIHKDGSITNVQVQNDSLNLKPYIKTALKDLPKWNPKIENGEPVVSQKAFKIEIPSKPKVLQNVYTKASPQNGMQKFYKGYVSSFNINAASTPIDELKFVVTFIVEKDGSFTNIEVVDANTPLYHSEIIRVIKSMPKWNPALENGIPVRSKFTLPVKIKIKD